MRKIAIFILLIVFACSCTSFLEEYSQDEAKIESLQDLDELLLGEVYLPVNYPTWNYGISFEYADMAFQKPHYMSDELSVYTVTNYNASASTQSKMFGWHTWQQEVGLNYEGNLREKEDVDWHQAYHGINVANIILDEIKEHDAVTSQAKAQKFRIQGEAHFLRALYYFQLVNLCGKPYCKDNLSSPGVILKLTSYVEDHDYTLSTVEEVYHQITKDLQQAEECLLQTEPKNTFYRANLTAVYLLKSRVALYMQDWEEAYAYAKKTLERNDNLLDLNGFDNSAAVLSKSSPETIFSMGGHVLAPCIMTNNGEPVALHYTISADLAASYDEGENDLRTAHYIVKKFAGRTANNLTSNEWVFNKVDTRRSSYGKACDVSDCFLFRTSEAYLNAAEAAACLDKEDEARSLLKKLRDCRMVNSRTITETGEVLLTLIRNERQRELCLEGHRWFDLRRYMVNEKYPYSKVIEHKYAEFYPYFSDANKALSYSPMFINTYRLEKNDEAYTLALPKEVRDFQNTLGVNNRPNRPVVSSWETEGGE